MEYYPKSRTDHIAKVMRLDPRKEWLASRLYDTSYSWCRCREDHTINPPCGSVTKARDTIDLLLGEALSVGLITEVTPYVIPPEPKYDWEYETLGAIESMSFEDHADFIREMDQKELDAFIIWRREQKR